MGDSEAWTAGNAAVRPRREITPWEPLPQPADHTSTYSSAYQAWPLPPRQKAKKPKDERPMSAARFDTRSTMQDSFQNWSGINQRSVSCRPTSAYQANSWMQPISTTHREAFQSWSVPKRTPFRPAQARDAPSGGPTGRSTQQDSFQPFASFVRTQSAQPKEKRLDEFPFEGTTTSRTSYQPWPVQPTIHRGKKPAENQSFMGGEQPFPNSTYRDMFREIKIPSGAASQLGLQVVGGKFHPMIPRGTKPPASKKLMMTTASDKQTSLDVVVVVADEHGKRGKKVAEFEVDGIAPARAGVPQIEVTFVLSNDHSLRVSALDHQGNRSRSLTVKEKVRLS